MSQTSDNNKRIAKNSLYLYLRVFVAMCINFYTSRLILEYLGVDDFGIYNVVGSIVSLMTFLNSTMRGATSRFLTYYLGKGDMQVLTDCFSASMLVHTAIALLLLVVGETVGLWFVNTQISIPEPKMTVANWIYQFSLIASCAAIIQVPYNATVISHERMEAFAYLEILHVVLKMVVVFPLVLFPDRLFVYGLLIMLVEWAVTLLYVVYCCRSFSNCKIRLKFSKEQIYPLLKFSILDLYGNGTFAIRQQGINVLINRFFGVAINAASGLATQVNSAISTFVNNILTAFRPQIIKEYANENYPRMEELMKMECMISLTLGSFAFVPLFVNIEFVIELWLKTVPVSTVEFCRCLLVYSMFSIIYTSLFTSIHATGDIKKYSFYAGTFNLFALALTYWFFILGCADYFAYISLVICMLLQIVVTSVILQKLIPEISVKRILGKCIVPLLLTATSLVVCFQLRRFVHSQWINTAASFAVTILMFCPYILYSAVLRKRKNKLTSA